MYSWQTTKKLLKNKVNRNSHRFIPSFLENHQNKMGPVALKYTNFCSIKPSLFFISLTAISTTFSWLSKFSVGHRPHHWKSIFLKTTVNQYLKKKLYSWFFSTKKKGRRQRLLYTVLFRNGQFLRWSNE